ncbi:MAG: hypothetical protein E4H14_02565, partial [Candidatus Thorarchaeota archaeon]
MQERSAGSEKELEKTTPEEYVPKEWFKVACYLASRGKQVEAELAIRNALKERNEFPIAWAIMSAILLAQGRETDAEQAGKKAIAQCKELKITWPKMRTIIFSHGVIRGTSWKDPRRVVIEATATTEWGNLISILGKASEQDLGEISSSQETFDDKEESQAQASSKEYTPTRKIDVTEKKKYESAEKRYQSHEDRKDEQELKSESMREYTPTRQIDVTEKKKYESAEKRYKSHEDREDEQELKSESMREYTPTRKIDRPQKIYDITDKKEDVIESSQVENPEILFAAADELLKRGNLKKAEEALVKGLTINPRKGDAWLSLS